MNLSKFNEILEKTDINVTYGYRVQDSTYPCITYNFDNATIFYADGINYYSSGKIIVKLFTLTKDVSLETKLEDVLSTFTYTKVENFIQNEKLYQITYEIGL